MRLYKKKRSVSLGVSLLVFAAILVLFVYGINSTYQKTEDESFNNTKASIERAIINCFAIEGKYPQNMQYLEQNYSLYIDHANYAVMFQSLGENIRPAFTLVKLKK